MILIASMTLMRKILSQTPSIVMIEQNLINKPGGDTCRIKQILK